MVALTDSDYFDAMRVLELINQKGSDPYNSIVDHEILEELLIISERMAIKIIDIALYS